MKKYKTLIFFIALFFSGFIAIFYIEEAQCYLDEDQIIIGKLYFHSYRYDNDNPFEKANIDTVEVLNIKDGYVQYKFTSSRYPSSTSMRMFRRTAKNITN